MFETYAEQSTAPDVKVSRTDEYMLMIRYRRPRGNVPSQPWTTYSANSSGGLAPWSLSGLMSPPRSMFARQPWKPSRDLMCRLPADSPAKTDLGAPPIYSRSPTSKWTADDCDDWNDDDD